MNRWQPVNEKFGTYGSAWWPDIWRDMPLAVELGVKYFNIGSVINGYTSDPQPWNFDDAHQKIDYLLDHDITPIVGLDAWPTDAEKQDVEHSQYAFDGKMAAFIQEFSGKGIIWKGFNEANGADGVPNWFGHDIRFEDDSLHQWADYNARMNSLIKKYDPGAIFLTPEFYNTIGYNDNDHSGHVWSKALAAGIQDHGDALSMHPYAYGNGDGTPEDVFRAMQPDKRIKLPMVTTEFGFVSDRFGEDGQAKFNLREFFLLDLLGQPIISQYKIFGNDPTSDDASAMVQGDRKKPVYKLFYQVIMHDLKGFTLLERVDTDSDNDYVLRYVGATGDKLVYWTVDDEHNINYLNEPMDMTDTPQVTSLLPANQLSRSAVLHSPKATIIENSRRLNMALRSMPKLLARYGVNISALRFDFVTDAANLDDRSFYLWLHSQLPKLVDNLNQTAELLNNLNWFGASDKPMSMITEPVPAGLLLERSKWNAWWSSVGSNLSNVQNIMKQHQLVE